MHTYPERNLNQLINQLETEEITGNLNITINGLSNDSRLIKPGNLFIAIKGYRNDGHSFIEDAIKKGAKAVVSEKAFPNSPVPVIRVKNSRYAQAILAAEFFDHPSSKLKVLGITGTNGKSTSTFMVNNILETAGFHTGLLGTGCCKIGKTKYPSSHTTPDSIKLQSLLAEMVDQQISHAILEVSSHGVALDRITKVNFDVGGITNITFDHLEFHPDMRDYVNTKGKFFTFLPQDKTAIFNGDDSLSLNLIRQTSARTITYGIHSNLVTIQAVNITRISNCTKFDVIIREPFFTITRKQVEPTSFPINLHRPGKHNIYNVLLAIATCLTLDLSITEIQNGISSFQGVPRRLEVIYNNKFRVINDVAHNPASFQAAFNTIQEENFNNLYIVNAIRGNRGVEINRKNTQVIIEWSKKLKPKNIFLTSADDTCGVLDKVQKEELQVVLGLFEENQVQMEYHDELETSIRNACSRAGENDLVVFFGTNSMNKVVEIFQRVILDK